MEFKDLLKYRQSTRKFTEQPVSKEDIEKILLAGNAAPVGSNLYKDLHFTVITDRQILHTLAEAARYRLKDKETMRKIVRSVPGKENVENEFDPFYGSSCVIFVSHRRQDLQPGIEYSNAASTVLAMHLAATDLGLGSVFMWDLSRQCAFIRSLITPIFWSCRTASSPFSDLRSDMRRLL